MYEEPSSVVEGSGNSSSRSSGGTPPQRSCLRISTNKRSLPWNGLLSRVASRCSWSHRHLRMSHSSSFFLLPLDEHLLPLFLCLHLALNPYGGTSAKLMGTITLLISAMLSCESLSSWSLFSLSYSSLSHLIFPFQSSISPFSVFCPCIDKSSHCQCSRSRII
jgi:hypothetical protein